MPGTQDKLNERNTKWLNNDYVKFIRMAQVQIEDSQLGVIGFINPNAYLDSPTFRGMRYSLWRTFDQLYVFDLHGNTRARWKHGRSVRDENIFDIRQGVCMNLWVKSQLGPEEIALGSLQAINPPELTLTEMPPSGQERTLVALAQRLLHVVRRGESPRLGGTRTAN